MLLLNPPSPLSLYIFTCVSQSRPHQSYFFSFLLSGDAFSPEIWSSAVPKASLQPVCSLQTASLHDPTGLMPFKYRTFTPKSLLPMKGVNSIFLYLRTSNSAWLPQKSGMTWVWENDVRIFILVFEWTVPLRHLTKHLRLRSLIVQLKPKQDILI